jgi:surface protein
MQNKYKTQFLKKIKDNKGAALVEYGMLVGLIAVLAIVSVLTMGGTVRDIFNTVSDTLSNRYELEGDTTVTTGGPQIADACYEPANVGLVAAPELAGCGGMLIADYALLSSAASANVGGDETFSITVGGTAYTFAQDGNDIFTGQATSMDQLFYNTSFNGDIGYWETGNVVDMGEMFRNNTAFNQDISGWDVSNVEFFSHMFNAATSFNQNLNSWDVSGARTFNSMFRTFAYNQPLDNWDVSNANDFQSMFAFNPTFNQDISNWDMSSAERIHSMFNSANAFNQPIGNWTFTPGELTGAASFLRDANTFNQDLSGWCVNAIPSEPNYFDTDASSYSAPRPNWGAACS